MPDPELITCPDGVWTKVATAVRTGMIHIKDLSPAYFQTYRVTGEAPPPANLNEAVSVSVDGAAILGNEDIDVYIYAQGAEGRVRVDL